MFQFRSIGTVQSCYPDKFGTPRQPGLAPAARAFLQLQPDVQPEFSLERLCEFSHLWVIFVFHKNTDARFHAKVHPPRLGGASVGVFASRSPHRPNPIGLSLVKIESVEVGGVWVSGVDLIEGTPILDIKPYLPAVEAVPTAARGWSDEVAPVEVVIEWSTESLTALEQAPLKSFASSLAPLKGMPSHLLTVDEVKNLIEQTLRLDPRPVVYRGYEGEESPYRDAHAVRVYNLDVHFRFVSAVHVVIDKVLF